MINNQIPTLAGNKTDLFAEIGKNGAEKGEGKDQGGLFKFLMSSVQQDGDGKNSGGNGKLFPGGNLIQEREAAADGKDVKITDILAGLDENTKNELITISRLLNGSDELKSDGDSSDEEITDLSPAESELTAEESEIDGNQAELFGDNAKSEGEEKTEAESNQTIAGEQQVFSGTNVQADRQGTDTDADTELPENGGRSLHAPGENVAAAGSSDINEPISLNEAAGTAGFSGSEAAAGDAPVKGESSEKKETQPVKGLSGELKSGTESPLFQSLSAEGLKTEKDSGEVKQENYRSGSISREDRESGFVSQLRAFAASHSLAAQQTQTESVPPAEVKEVKTAESENVQKMFSDLALGNLNQEAAEVRSLKANQIREIRYSNYQSGLSGRQETGFTGSDISTSPGAGVSVSDTNKLNMMSVSGVAPAGVSASVEQIDQDAAAMWKEHIAEYFESKEKSSAEQASALTKLNDFAVTNISVRRNFAMSIGQAIMSATGEGKKAAETWQKHTFKLDNGSNIQLSAREVDGVLQLRLSSSSPELNKLLTDHQDEIREHLGKEIDIQIDLQLDSQGDGQQAGFLAGTGGQEQRGSQFLDENSAKTSEQAVEEVVPKAVRKFGYNQMEWTA